MSASNILTRLDRFLVHSPLLDGNSIVSTKILPKLTSYHHPIALIFEKEEEMGPIPFRFSPLWIERVGFMEMVSQAWSSYVKGSPSFVWEQKMKHTKIALKLWVKTPLPSPTSNRKDRVAELADLQFKMEIV